MSDAKTFLDEIKDARQRLDIEAENRAAARQIRQIRLVAMARLVAADRAIYKHHTWSDAAAQAAVGLASIERKLDRMYGTPTTEFPPEIDPVGEDR